MKKKILLLAASLLVLGCVTLLPGRVNAESADHGHLVTADAPARILHSQDNYTTFYCTKHRTNELHTITHAVWMYLDTENAGMYCREQFFSVQRQYWVWVHLPLNSNNSWEPWAKQECKPTGPFPCDEP